MTEPAGQHGKTISLLITAGPQRPGALTALHTTHALLRSPHRLYRLFFYGDGVHLANRFVTGARACSAWQGLARDAALPAVVCVGAALRRGLRDAGEARRAGDPADNLAEGFTLVGLGDWVDALTRSDRVVHFG